MIRRKALISEDSLQSDRTTMASVRTGHDLLFEVEQLLSSDVRPSSVTAKGKSAAVAQTTPVDRVAPPPPVVVVRHSSGTPLTSLRSKSIQDDIVITGPAFLAAEGRLAEPQLEQYHREAVPLHLLRRTESQSGGHVSHFSDPFHAAEEFPVVAAPAFAPLPQEHVDDAINDMFDAEGKTIAVIEALLSTARQNTDLTELDIICRRIRQQEIEQLEDAIALLSKGSAFLKKRCNVLFDQVNRINEQQTQLVDCLEAALVGSSTTDASQQPPAVRGDKKSALQPPPFYAAVAAEDGEDVSSLQGNAQRRGGGTSASSQAGGKRTSQEGGTRVSSKRPQEGASTSGIVSPYKVMSGPLTTANLDKFYGPLY